MSTAFAPDVVAAPRLWTTRDCRMVLLRPIGGDDAALFESFINGLSPRSRMLRFHTGLTSLPPSWLQWMTRPDPRHEHVLLAIAEEQGKPTCIGEARYALGDGPPGEREFALVIADGWQGAGLGRALLTQLTEHAEQHGVTQLVGDVMRDNLPMLELARRCGYGARTHRGDARLLQVARALGPPVGEPLLGTPRPALSTGLAH